MTAPGSLTSPLALEALRDPVSGASLVELTELAARFADGRTYPCVDRRPILIDEASSLFSIEEIARKTSTTQDADYRDRSNLKNYIRQRLLPGLTWDRHGTERMQRLAQRVAGAPVLVIGAGDRIEKYRAQFPDSLVVTSDVHLQFNADCALDAHAIPFRDRFFGLVLAAQVLEHTARPWIVASEMQRVTKLGGLIHVEVPFGFGYHGAPYDFFRFTPSALRFLFSSSSVVELDVTEGRFSAAAVSLSNGVIDTFQDRRLRQAAVAGTRLALWWMRYLDAMGAVQSRFTSPKGLYVTVAVDGNVRSDRAMLDDVERLLSSTPSATT